jgi:UDP-N-acetylglucosamine 3-dehydrogenase
VSAPPRIGVVGFGAIGRHHARNLAEMPDAEFIGVFDHSESARGDAARLGHATYSSLARFIAGKPHAAVVSVPTASHHAVALELIEAGVAVLIEKPIATTVEQGESLIAASRRAGLPMMVGYVERYNSALIATRNFFQAGNIGRPLDVATRRVGALPPRIRDANVIVDIGVHDIDAIAFLTKARLRLISAQGGSGILQDRLDYASLALDADGIAAHAQMNWLTPVKVRELTITGTSGYLHVDYLRQEARFAPGREFQSTESFAEVVAQYEEGKMFSLPIEKREPLRVQLETFVAGLHGEPLPDPELSLASLGIALEATEAIERKTKAFA